jgi:hypothetical protein
MDILIRRVKPAEYDALGEITAQAYLKDGLLDFGESDGYLGELRDVGKRAAAADVLVATRGEHLLGGVTFVPAGGPMAEVARPGEAEIRMLAVRRTAASASSCRHSAPCAPPIASTTASASSASRSATGTRFRNSTTSLSSPTS